MTTTETIHRIEVSATAKEIYRIVSDVSLWPLYFPPTVWAERVDGGETEETIRIWALANGELRSWRSRRRLYPAEHRIAFGQVEPREPVAAMGGAWTLDEKPDGGCTVVLDHAYRATGGNRANLDRIAKAVDTNSRAELEHLKRAAERGDRESELLLDFTDSETIAGPTKDVYDFIYDVASWPERIPHVDRIDLREDEPGLQVMEMDTRSPDGSVHTTVSGRVCFPATRIVYKQTKLPPALQAHTGEWLFQPTPDGSTTVTSRHRVILDPDAIAALPKPPESLDAARLAVRDALGGNSRATMARAKEFVESRRAGGAS